jgi:predicted YcjX-like family ATPase
MRYTLIKINNKLSSLIRKSFRQAANLTDDGLKEMSTQFDRLRDKRFCLGITGLSQSGKSTFITSLINQLLEHDNAALAGFSPALGERLLGVKIHPLEDLALSTFAYAESYQRIASATPQWPLSTQNISGCLLELRLSKPRGQLNPLRREEYSLWLEIRDYPGEWLLDLPLRGLSYSQWCSQCSEQYNTSPRKEILANLPVQLEQLDPLAVADDATLQRLHNQFVEFLKACKSSSHRLSLIQPGRFLIPGDIPDAKLLLFIPLLNIGRYSDVALQNAPNNSFFKICQSRYQRYVKELIDPFYQSFFRRIDRQLVLVDVVNALHAGPAAVADMQQALSNITDSFVYGKQSRFAQLFSPKIDKVVFAATKIDQVLSEDHESVRQLLGQVVRAAYKSAQHEGVAPECEATAAVRSSHEVRHNGEQGIAGFDTSGEPIGYVHPSIPLRVPEGEEWQAFLEWHMPKLNPPKGLSAVNYNAMPHIRMDSVLNMLIGDKCQ